MGQQFQPDAPLISEPIAVPDTFATGLYRVEIHGSIVHFILCNERNDAEGRKEIVICARILMPKESVPAAVRMAIAAVSNDFIDRRLPGIFRFAS